LPFTPPLLLFAKRGSRTSYQLERHIMLPIRYAGCAHDWHAKFVWKHLGPEKFDDFVAQRPDLLDLLMPESAFVCLSVYRVACTISGACDGMNRF
jgi:hypothetical protein